MAATMHDLAREVNGSSVPAAGPWVIDGSHSSAEFVARHLMVTKVRGNFQDVAGTIVVGEDPAASTVEVNIQTGSLTTGDADRDGHVTSPDFRSFRNYGSPAVLGEEAMKRALGTDSYATDAQLMQQFYRGDDGWKITYLVDTNCGTNCEIPQGIQEGNSY